VVLVVEAVVAVGRKLTFSMGRIKVFIASESCLLFDILFFISLLVFILTYLIYKII
jgi:hypothetical protein